MLKTKSISYWGRKTWSCLRCLSRFKRLQNCSYNTRQSSKIRWNLKNCVISCLIRKRFFKIKFKNLSKTFTTLWRRKMQLLMTWGQKMRAWSLKKMNYLNGFKHLSKRNLKTDHLTYKRHLKTKFWNTKDFLTSVQAESKTSFTQMTNLTSPQRLIAFKTHSLQQNNLVSWACRQKTIKINCWTKLKCLMNWPKI